MSIHADPACEYPFYWGYADETGSGDGFGKNHNFPLPIGTKWEEYQRTLSRAMDTIWRHDPTYLVVSLGFDTLASDKLGRFLLEVADFATMGYRVASLGFYTLIVLEGGYAEDKELGAAASAFVAGMVRWDTDHT